MRNLLFRGFEHVFYLNVVDKITVRRQVFRMSQPIMAGDGHFAAQNALLGIPVWSTENHGFS
ncbi:hypothetical protein J4464_07020 [Candidatus Woesearchaeota archaeon]|nr:hypothetical protein [Candidatus Woesearchaeota archaeon]